MSDTKKYTERELVEAKRQGLVDGAVYGANRITGNAGYYPMRLSEIEAEAKRRYPLTVTRARKITDCDGDEWRIRDGIVECGHGQHLTDLRAHTHLTTQLRNDEQFRRDFASLLLEPNEVVDADSQSDESQRSVPGQEADR